MIRKFNNKGNKIFSEFIHNLKDASREDTPTFLLHDPEYSEIIDKDRELEKKNFKTRYELGKSLIKNLDGPNLKYRDIYKDEFLWNWITLYYVNELDFITGGKEFPRFLLSNDWKHTIKHLVRTPWYLLTSYGDDVSWLLQKVPNKHDNFIEQIFKRSWLGQNLNILNLCEKLYFDHKKNQIKPSCDRGQNGGLLRLAAEADQLAIIYNIVDMDKEKISKILNSEFDIWK